MLIHPVPDRHIHQRDSGDFVGGPEIVQRFFRLAAGVGRRKSEQFEIVTLEHECQRFCECGIGNAFQQSVVNSR